MVLRRERSRSASLLVVCCGVLILISMASNAVNCNDESFESPGQARPHLPETSLKTTSNPLLLKPLYKFTANLFNKIKDTNKNVIFSPLSVHTALNMLSLGIGEGSQTEKEVHQALGYDKTNMPLRKDEIHETNAQLRSVFEEIKAASNASRRNPKVDMINYAIVNETGIGSEYLKKVNKYYGASVRHTKNEDEQEMVANEINKWGKEAGFSNDILPKKELAESKLALLNGIRVEAFWFDNFHENIIDDNSTSSPLYKWGTHHDKHTSSTQSGKLALTDYEKQIKYVEFTKNKQSKNGARNERARAKQPDHYDELAQFEFRAIKIPLYGDISYTIIEPLVANGTRKDLGKLEEMLMVKQQQPEVDSSDRMSKLLAFVDGESSVAANIRMPGFKYEQETDLNEPLSSMGFGRIFNVRTADLTNMSSKKDLYVDKVKHQAMIEVNEKGIKAAGVTRVLVSLSAIFHREVIEVNVENPFIYLLRLDKVPLFVGHLVEA